MATGSVIAIYFVIWWISLFAVLPFGIRSQHGDGAVVPGTDPGAPVRPRLLRIVLWNSVLAAAVLAGFLLLRRFGVTLHSIPILRG